MMNLKRALFAVVVAMAMTTPALAIDFSAELTQLDGKPFVGTDGKEVKTTLGQVCEQALLATYPDERDPNSGKETVTPEEKFRRWQLAAKVRGKDVSLSAEDLALLKKLIGKGYPPLVVGQAWTMLDPGMK